MGEFYRILKPGGQFLVFDLRRNAPVLAHFLIRFITAAVVPEPLRRIKEPLGSILASYTPGEVASILDHTPFTDFGVKKGLFWQFAWGRKSN
jgi:ubiquinone/menaquinone biosynthesis C-methylase UbiE